MELLQVLLSHLGFKTELLDSNVDQKYRKNVGKTISNVMLDQTIGPSHSSPRQPRNRVYRARLIPASTGFLPV